ncbi:MULTISPECIES: cold-shock protein [Edaphocola]|jgi:cold shock CspA family protein|uniref:cold-shock protein n=1 Tax=Edaphocola TaxID=2601681 RepID=UPI00100B6F24|nr:MULTISPECIES: cold shock domain-containing protein [Edaphocola]
MADTFSKKEREKKKAKKKQDKAEKKEDRKTNNDKGKSLEEMTVYLDENGNLTDVPPDQQQIRKPAAQDHRRNFDEAPDDTIYTGMVSLLFTDKDYGFITEDNSRNTVFVHVSKFKEPIQEKDRVSFFKKKTPNGYSAVNVKKIK